MRKGRPDDAKERGGEVLQGPLSCLEVERANANATSGNIQPEKKLNGPSLQKDGCLARSKKGIEKGESASSPKDTGAKVPQGKI